jgi:hypothetical protein
MNITKIMPERKSGLISSITVGNVYVTDMSLEFNTELAFFKVIVTTGADQTSRVPKLVLSVEICASL